MNIEIKITAASAEEARAAFAQLAGERPATHITVIPNDPRTTGGELTIPAGTDLTIADVTRDSVTLTSDPSVEPMPMPEPAPEKPKARKKAAKQPEPEKPAETPQIAPSEPVADAAPAAPATPQAAAVEPVAAPEAKVPTLDEIARAGAALLDADAGKMTQLLDLLKEYGVQAITQLKPEQLPGFAARLKAIGAEV